MYDRNKGIIIDDNIKSATFDEILDDFLRNGEHDYRSDNQPPVEPIKNIG